MQEKHKDLEATRQKQLVYDIISKLNELHPSLYYAATTEVAYQVELYIKEGNGLSREEIELLSGLSRNDIQIILSLH